MRFIQIDVTNFYPSITEELLKNAIDWARGFIDISCLDEEVIFKSKKSVLYFNGSPWVKKDGNFDVAQGSFDGAECAELVGLFILKDIVVLDRKLNPGIYRDDFLAVMRASPRQLECMRKKIEAVF